MKYNYRETFKLEEDKLNELANSVSSNYLSLNQLNESAESFKVGN